MDTFDYYTAMKLVEDGGRVRRGAWSPQASVFMDRDGIIVEQWGWGTPRPYITTYDDNIANDWITVY